MTADPPRIGTVLAVEAITPLVRRLVLGGSDMASFRTPPGTLGPYLKFRLPGPDGRTCLRTYSIRRYDRRRTELHVDVVLHEGASLGAAFAEAAAPGDTLALGGPGFMPAPPVPAYLLAGDHTALPAIAQILDTLPDGPAVTALIEVPDRSEEQPLPTGPGRSVSWLHRAAGSPSRLAEAVRDAWPGDPVLLFAGAEATIARAIRLHARRDRGLPADRCQVLNYWKRGRPEGEFSYVA